MSRYVEICFIQFYFHIELCFNMNSFGSNPVLNRCVPLKGEGPTGVLYNLYGYLNTMDVLEQVLADLYASWDLILIFIFLTLGKLEDEYDASF